MRSNVAISLSTLAAASAVFGQGITVDSNVICTGCQKNGIQENGSETNEVPSLTSNENFVNFCAGQDGGPSNLAITNGVQITSGSCNPVPMGVIAATTNMPASKFTNPKNLDTLPANQEFTITMAIQNLETGNFVNADTNYYAAPCFVNSNGDIVGHSHVVVSQLQSLTQTDIAPAADFVFFKGLNDAAVNGVLSATVTEGLPAGVYKVGSINACANHQPALVAVAQHAPLDDQVYFTVADGGSSSGSSSSSSSKRDVDDDNTEKRSAAAQEPEAAAKKMVKRASKGRRLNKRRMDLERRSQ